MGAQLDDMLLLSFPIWLVGIVAVWRRRHFI
jgi:hypothetical protein